MILIMPMPLISLYLVRFEIHIVVFTLNVHLVLEFSGFLLVFDKKKIVFLCFFAGLICLEFWFWFVFSGQTSDLRFDLWSN